MILEIETINEPASDSRVILLIKNLNDALKDITGNDGSSNAELTDFSRERALFLIALRDGKAVACGGFRPLNSEICEIKRMFAVENKTGLGLKILQELECSAKNYGYKSIFLETRRVNDVAVRFYLKNGYEIIDNYGVYIGRSDAVCFGKLLMHSKK